MNNKSKKNTKNNKNEKNKEEKEEIVSTPKRGRGRPTKTPPKNSKKVVEEGKDRHFRGTSNFLIFHHRNTKK